MDGGLVASYLWIVNGSHYYPGLLEEITIMDFVTVTSRLTFNGNNTQVGTFQSCIQDGLGRISSGFFQINGIVYICLDSCSIVVC